MKSDGPREKFKAAYFGARLSLKKREELHIRVGPV